MRPNQSLKPPDLDDYGRPIKTEKPPDLDEYGNPEIPEQPGFLSQVWSAISEPLTDLPSRISKKISPWLDNPEAGRAMLDMMPMGTGRMIRALRGDKANAEAGGFMAGGIEGAGDLASDMTSPLNIGTTLATGGSNIALRAGLSPAAVKGFQTAAKGLGMATEAHGGMEMGGAAMDFFDPNISLSDTAGRFGRGAVELAGGELARRHIPRTDGPILSRVWPEKATPEQAVADLLPKLKDSLERDAARRGSPPPPPSDSGGPREVVLPFPHDPVQIKDLKRQGYDFVGMDEKGNMTLVNKNVPEVDPNLNQGVGDPNLAGSVPYRHTSGEAPFVNPETQAPYLPYNTPEEFGPPVGPMPNEQPGLPGVELPNGPMEGGFPLPEQDIFAPLGPPRDSSGGVEFAFMDYENFPEPMPFFHLPDGSTVSAAGMQARGMEVPQLPDEQLGIGSQFPGIESQDVGAVPNQEIDLNQALMQAESDMAKPVQGQRMPPPMPTFADQVLGEQTGRPVMDPMQAQRNLEHQLQNIEEGPVMPGQENRGMQPPPRMPHEFAPDIRQTTEFYPETSGESPRFESFGEQVLGDEGPLWSKDRPNKGKQLSIMADKLRKAGLNPADFPELRPDSFEAQVLPDEPRTPQQEQLITDAQGVIKTQIKADVRHSASELTSGYNKPLPAVMAREGIQNALDAFVGMPGTRGQIHVTSDSNYLKISDNGIGMSPQELNTVFTTLHGSGKRTQEGAKGGKGVGKATYMLGGSHFEVETVKEINGQKVRSFFEGAPDTFFDEGGINIQHEIVDPDTPTGTTFKTTFDSAKEAYKGESQYRATNELEKISKYSRGLAHDITVNKWGSDEKMNLKDKSGNASIIKETVGNGVAEVEVLIPEGSKLGKRSYMEVYYLNDGYYQFDKSLYLGEEQPGVPESIIVDVKSLVPETDPKYPFPVQRESVKDFLNNEIESLIKEKLVNPFASKKKMDLAKLWNQMPTVENPEGTRPTVLFDPGDRLTPQERQAFQNSYELQDLTQAIDETIESILVAVGHNSWRSKLERVGIILGNEGEYGIHIPNPQAPKDAPKSAILINPFAHIAEYKGLTPRDAAIDLVVTTLHEVAHIGTENSQSLPKIHPQDLSDPRVGRYLQTYMKEVMEQGGIDAGHNMPFVHRLGEVYASYGTRRGLSAAQKIESILSDPNTGGYRPEVQELLRIHSEARGRTPTTEDILSGTGVRSKARGGREGNVPSNDSGPGGGTVRLRRQHATPERVKQLKERGYEWDDVVGDHVTFKKTSAGGPGPVLESEVGSTRPRGTSQGEPEPALWKEIYNAPRTLLASNDLSAPLRQGIGLIHKKEFWKALPSMFKSWATEEGFQAVQADIANKALFRKRKGADGKELPSFAEDAGLAQTDMVNNREELFLSKVVGKVPGVHRSNRAYVAFLNKLRADTFETLIKNGKVFGADGTTNIPLSREIAKFVNNATGRGTLGGLEQTSKVLNYGLFAPRLIASRLQTLNPHYYWAASPFVRKEALKSLFAIATVGNVVNQLGRLAGGEVSSDPSSSDFGKLKVGDSRLDPYGGYQQYIVAANRLLNPMGPATGFEGGTPFTRGQMVTSSSNPENEYNLWNQEGPYDPTWGDAAGRFVRGKVHPLVGFIWSLVTGRKELSGEKMKFGLEADRPVASVFENSLAQRVIPIFLQDMAELAQNEELPPQIKAMVATLSAFGMGQQTYGPKGD